MKMPLLAASCMAVMIAAAPAIHAGTVTGSYYLAPSSALPGGNIPVSGSSFYASPTATFTVTSPGGTSILNMDSDNTASGYTVGGFLASGGNTVNFLTGSSFSTYLLDFNGTPSKPTSCAPGTTCAYNAVYQFTGSVYLTAGKTYDVQHDDGILLYLTGASGTDLAIDSPGPSVDYPPASFSVSTSGVYSFELDYGEVDGAPAVLLTPTAGILPIGEPLPTPEPSSFVLLGSGLLAAAGMIRRRMTI